MGWGKYILKDKKLILESDILVWGMWMENADRHVKKDTITINDKEFWISTVFLGLDHNFSDNDSNPIVFETMIFPRQNTLKDYEISGYQERYSTWEQAEQGHQKAIDYLNKLLTNKKD